MVFQQPVWFLLLVPLGCVLYFWRIPSKLLAALRVIALVLIVLAMTGPMILLPARSGTIVVVADRSLSMPVEAKGLQRHSVNLLLNHMEKEDLLGVVSFATGSVPERPPSKSTAGVFDFGIDLPDDSSDLKGGLENALSLIPMGDKGRLLVLSDGRWTGENPDLMISRFVQRGVAVDYRIMERPMVGDIAIAAVDAPDRVLPGEFFKIVAWVNVPVSQEVGYKLMHNGEVAKNGEGKREMTSGLNKLEFTLKAGVPGALMCELRVEGENEDPVLENNHARKLIGVEGDKPLLVLVAKSENGSPIQSKLAEVLRVAAIEADVSDGSGIRWTLPFLSRYSGIVLENVPASQIGVPGMELIAQWVRETGTGLMFTGGKGAYALGGYYQSPLDDIMPVSMEIRKEHRKLAVAVAVLMDCSGSMGMMVPGGKIKMDLANLGAAEVLNILTPMDEVAVLTCDTGIQTILPLKRNTDPVVDRQRILRTGPGGGGIFVYTGLLGTTKMLSQAQADTKHVILFTDADDTEEPGDYVKLLESCKKAGMTCSVIALGTEKDRTADLCRDIARVGGGNIYFTEIPNDLPRLFAQDTFTISRSTFLEDPTPFHFTGGMLTLSGIPFVKPPKLGGYNLCYLKPGALPSAISDDDYSAPIVASWQAGLGRVLCYTGQVDGQFTGSMASWDQYNSMLASLGRWTAGRVETLPNNMMLTQTIEDGSCRIQLHLDPEQENNLEPTPTVTILRQLPRSGITKESLPLQWIEPELLDVTVPLTGNETIQATLLLYDQPGRDTPTPFQLPPVCLPYSPEFRPPGAGKGVEALRQLAATTDGVERLELTGMWKDIPKVPRYFEFSSWLIYAAMTCLVVEVFQRRTGWISAWSKRLVARIRRKPVLKEKDREESGTADDDSGDKSVSIFRRLNLRKKQREMMQSEHADSGERDVSTSSAGKESAEKPKPDDSATPATGVFDALKKAKNASKKRTGKD